MTIRIGLWLLATWLCLPAFSFQFQSATQAPITYEGIIYTQKPDGKWYASDALGESNDASFMNRVIVKLANQENPWGLALCTERDVQLDPSLPVAQGRYIGFGWSLLVYPSEAAGIAAANFLATERSQEEPMIQFDARVQSLSTGNLDPYFYAQRNLENTFQNCGDALGAGNGSYPIELAIQDLWQMAAAAQSNNPAARDHQSVIAVIDDSFYMDHLDLQGGFWVNEDEALDG